MGEVYLLMRVLRIDYDNYLKDFGRCLALSGCWMNVAVLLGCRAAERALPHSSPA